MLLQAAAALAGACPGHKATHAAVLAALGAADSCEAAAARLGAARLASLSPAFSAALLASLRPLLGALGAPHRDNLLLLLGRMHLGRDVAIEAQAMLERELQTPGLREGVAAAVRASGQLAVRSRGLVSGRTASALLNLALSEPRAGLQLEALRWLLRIATTVQWEQAEVGRLASLWSADADRTVAAATVKVLAKIAELPEGPSLLGAAAPVAVLAEATGSEDATTAAVAAVALATLGPAAGSAVAAADALAMALLRAAASGSCADTLHMVVGAVLHDAAAGAPPLAAELAAAAAAAEEPSVRRVVAQGLVRCTPAAALPGAAVDWLTDALLRGIAEAEAPAPGAADGLLELASCLLADQHFHGCSPADAAGDAPGALLARLVEWGLLWQAYRLGRRAAVWAQHDLAARAFEALRGAPTLESPANFVAGLAVLCRSEAALAAPGRPLETRALDAATGLERAQAFIGSAASGATTMAFQVRFVELRAALVRGCAAALGCCGAVPPPEDAAEHIVVRADPATPRLCGTHRARGRWRWRM